MTTDYTTLKKELTKAIKGAGYNTKQIKILKGSGVGGYYSETSFSLCSYGEDVEFEINEKGITVDQVNEITRETLKKYEARATIKASDALRGQFNDLAEEVNKKIEEVKIVGVVYVDNEKNVEIYAHRYDAHDVRLYTRATDLKSEYVKSYTEKSTNKDLLTLLTSIEISDPEVCDFSEAYLFDGDTKEEVDKRIEIYRTKQDIEKTEDKIAEEEELRNKIETGLKEAKAAEVAIINTVATYNKENGWGSTDVIYCTQRTEFAKLKNYHLNEYDGTVEQLDDDIETLKAQGYTIDTAAETGRKIEAALNIIRERITDKTSELQDQDEYVSKLYTYIKQAEEQLKESEEDLQKLLNK